MPSKSRGDLYQRFATGSKPTQDDFVDLIDSAVNIAEDGIGLETGKPMEIIQRGENKRFLDFSTEKNNPIWRIGAQSGDKERNGLNVTSPEDKSRLFIKKDNGFIGINNDNPEATLDIAPNSGSVLRVTDADQNPSLIMEADGSIGIGMNTQESYKVSIGGKTKFQDEVIIDGLVCAEEGITVNGAKLVSNQGLSVKNGTTIEGSFEAKNGLNVTGDKLIANAGAIIDGLALESRNGLSVDHGAIIKTGMLEAKAGAAVSGDLLKAENGLIVNNGIKIETGIMEAKDGLIVNGGVLEAKNGLTVQGKTVLKDEMLIEKGLITAQGGLSVTNGAVLLADGPVILGNTDNGNTIINGTLHANNEIIIGKTLEANAGAVVNGAELKANKGLTVQNGVTVETGELIVKDGLIVIGSTLKADGPVNLGSILPGSDVIINGGLNAARGAVISGSELVVDNGAKITGHLNVPDSSSFGNAVISSLEVTDITINGTFGLQSADLQSLKSTQAEIGSLITKGELEILGQCQISDNVVFRSGIISVTYEGPESVFPKLKIEQGIVSGDEGHFDITVDDAKLVTIIYDDDSDVNNFINDWNAYKINHPDKIEGFDFTRIGASSWDPHEMEINLVKTGLFQEHIVTENGLRILYTGSAEVSQFEIRKNEDTETGEFEFSIDGPYLIIQYPSDQTKCSVNQLLLHWQAWVSNNFDLGIDFEIQKTANSTGESLVTDIEITTLSPNSANNFLYKVIVKTNTVTVDGYIGFGDSGVIISDVSNSGALTENSDTIIPTQKAVKTYVDNGLAIKADQEYVTGEFGKKADRTELTDGLALKADRTELTDGLALKADRTELTDGLALKADRTELTDGLALKADAVATLTALAGKAGMVKPSAFNLGIGAITTINDIPLTETSCGILMVRITMGSTTKAGLFAVDRTDSIIKIAGDGMSDQRDNVDTCNIYSIAGAVTIQNASSNAAVALVTYFGE